jgi:hypothetical protein
MAKDYSKEVSSSSRLINKRKEDLVTIARANVIRISGTESKEELVQLIQTAQSKYITKIGKLLPGEY